MDRQTNRAIGQGAQPAAAALQLQDPFLTHFMPCTSNNCFKQHVFVTLLLAYWNGVVLFNKKFIAMFKTELLLFCCNSRQTQLHSWAGVSFLPVQEGQWPPDCHPAWHSSASLPFRCPTPPPPWEGLLLLLLLSSPKREDFSIWQLGMRLLAGFPPFAPLDLTKQDSCLPGPYAVPGRIYHWDPQLHRHQLTYQETCMFKRRSCLWAGWQEVSCMSSVYIKAEAGAQVTGGGWAPSVNKTFLLP